MIALDTNILVRYLTQDDPTQARLATELIERRISARNPGFISLVAMVEMVGVLERAYRLSAADIATAIERLLQATELTVENEQDVFTAMSLLKEGSSSFADALIVTAGRRAGCAFTATFDRRALRLPGFAAPDARP
jgi:predicted nucleic-acid-binding protein